MYSPFKRFTSLLTFRELLQILSAAVLIGGGIALAYGIEFVLQSTL